MLVWVWMGRGSQPVAEKAAGWEERRARLDVGVTVTASMRHPLLGYSSLQEAPEGIAPTGGRENKAGK